MNDLNSVAEKVGAKFSEITGKELPASINKPADLFKQRQDNPDLDRAITKTSAEESIKYSKRLRESLHQEIGKGEVLKELASVDSLTGLPNKRMLDEKIKEEVKRAQRYDYPLVLLMLDFNGFKDINNKAGHQWGDQVLQEISHKLRSSDFMARYGGDEFVVILPETTKELTHKAIERMLGIIDVFESRHKENVFRLGVSIGIASLGGKVDKEEWLIAEADKMMYVGKGHGKETQAQSSLLGSVTYRKNDKTVIEHYRRGDVKNPQMVTLEQ